MQSSVARRGASRNGQDFLRNGRSCSMPPAVVSILSGLTHKGYPPIIAGRRGLPPAGAS